MFNTHFFPFIYSVLTSPFPSASGFSILVLTPDTSVPTAPIFTFQGNDTVWGPETKKKV